MSRHSSLRAIGFAMVVLLLAACAMTPTPAVVPATVTSPVPTVTPVPPAATPHPFEGLDEWDVVIISDSSLWGVAEPYAKLIEQDRGVKVNLHDEWQGGLTIRSVRNALRGDFAHSAKREKWPKLIQDAEVLVLFGNPQESLNPKLVAAGWSCVDNRDPGEVSIAADSFAPYQADLIAVYDEIARLREGRPLILRATGIYLPVISVWREKGIDGVCGAFWEGQNQAARQAANERGVPFVDTYAAFNGPNHDEDPRTKGLIREDGEHPSEAGAQFYAELLRQSGYNTWVGRQP
jgi:hypothetical protein